MKKIACQYAVLRFRPYVETGEFANVGIALLAPDARFFGFRIQQRYGRITQFFPELDRQIYLNGRQLFKEEMDRFAVELQREALGGCMTQAQITLARNLFSELVRPREAMLQFSEQRIVLADDPEEKLQQLFDYYVERNFATKEYQERLLEHKVRQLLVRAELGTMYQREKIGTEEFAVNFPFVGRVNGEAERVIKPLFLAHADTTKLLTHGGQWVDKIRRLRSRNALPSKVLFPLTGPAVNTKSFNAFDEIRSDLLAASVMVVAADDEKRILQFAAEGGYVQ